jgi:lactoylglutathione lyase
MIDLRSNTITNPALAMRRAMADVVLSLVVLRCKNLELSHRFYELRGLRFVREQHENGPLHYVASLNGVVFELYPVQQSDLSCEPARLGFAIPSLTDTLQAMQTMGIQMLPVARDAKWYNSAIVLDPDGRKIEITESSDNPYQQL